MRTKAKPESKGRVPLLSGYHQKFGPSLDHEMTLLLSFVIPY
jgi:hypothetical protein